MHRNALFALAALLIVFAAPRSLAQSLDDDFERDILIIQTENACYRFDVWLAIDREQQMQGLMHVREMPLTSGMLFVYESEGNRSMWMKNTYISLDIAFARSDGRIVNIARETEPLSEVSIRSTEPASYVLELNAGVAETLGIESRLKDLMGPNRCG